MSKQTEFEKSNLDFNIDGKMIHLNEVERLEVFQRISCKVKVLSIEAPTDLPKGYRKQDVKVGDTSGTMKFTLWGSEIGSMEEGKSYKISRAIIKEYNGEKYLSALREVLIEEIRDEDVNDVEDERKEDTGKDEINA